MPRSRPLPDRQPVDAVEVPCQGFPSGSRPPDDRVAAVLAAATALGRTRWCQRRQPVTSLAPREFSPCSAARYPWPKEPLSGPSTGPSRPPATPSRRGHGKKTSGPELLAAVISPGGVSRNPKNLDKPCRHVNLISRAIGHVLRDPAVDDQVLTIQPPRGKEPISQVTNRRRHLATEIRAQPFARIYLASHLGAAAAWPHVRVNGLRHHHGRRLNASSTAPPVQDQRSLEVPSGASSASCRTRSPRDKSASRRDAQSHLRAGAARIRTMRPWRRGSRATARRGPGVLHSGARPARCSSQLPSDALLPRHSCRSINDLANRCRHPHPPSDAWTAFLQRRRLRPSVDPHPGHRGSPSRLRRAAVDGPFLTARGHRPRRRRAEVSRAPPPHRRAKTVVDREPREAFWPHEPLDLTPINAVGMPSSPRPDLTPRISVPPLVRRPPIAPRPSSRHPRLLQIEAAKARSDVIDFRPGIASDDTVRSQALRAHQKSGAVYSSLRVPSRSDSTPRAAPDPRELVARVEVHGQVEVAVQVSAGRQYPDV